MQSMICSSEHENLTCKYWPVSFLASWCENGSGTLMQKDGSLLYAVKNFSHIFEKKFFISIYRNSEVRRHRNTIVLLHYFFSVKLQFRILYHCI
ncbi:CFC_collapsed_G0048330.mRNA.1.CDS.1 [Saccharomyces cerevisiae]|nr:CFC_collapsed_G0048330.mRNA.1.CDS.1 [Saccharomyces cerevisiae]